MPTTPPTASSLEFIRQRVRLEDCGYGSPCWIWQLYLTRKGYARSWVPGFGSVRVHRAAYILAVGPILEGLTIDHLCRETACCNPDHLEAVTSIENYRRALPFMPYHSQTHCKRGHLRTPENRVKRDCRTCKVARNRDYRARLRIRESMECAA